MKADAKRIDRILDEFAGYNSTPGEGITRPSYSSEYRGVCHALVRMMRDLGMDPYMNEIGDLLGRKEGRESGKPAISMGSHLDTVRNGGRFDGTAGIACALELLTLLRENHIQLDHPLQLFCFQEEEGTALQGGLLGSRWFTGEASEKDVSILKYENTVDALQVIRDFRRDFPEIPSFDSMGSDPRDIRCFLEVHIEQGPVLEKRGLHVGVVSAIAGSSTIEVTVSGRPDHAGSTPMDLRADSFEVLARTAVEMYEYARSFPSTVATVGRVEIPGGSSNRVPGSTWFTLDLRSSDREIMDTLIPHAVQTLERVAAENGTHVEFSTSHFVPPVELDRELRRILLDKTAEVTGSAMELNSGAAHDSLVLAKYFPTAMLFVPSRGGRSHCPEEYSDVADLALAVDVMTQAVLELDQQ